MCVRTEGRHLGRKEDKGKGSEAQDVSPGDHGTLSLNTQEGSPRVLGRLVTLTPCTSHHPGGLRRARGVTARAKALLTCGQAGRAVGLFPG